MKQWPLVRLDQCTEIVSGATPDTSEKSYWNGDICWVTPKDLSSLEGAYISDTPRKITQRGLDGCAATILPSESVLFSSRAPIGHVAINTVPMATNQGFKSFIPDRQRVHPKYLYHWLRRNRPYLESLGNGATFKEVSKAVVSRIEIPLPPLPEQRRIAEVLDRADSLRARRRAALAQLDTLPQSIFLDMFGDPITNPKGWPKVEFGSVCDRVTVGIVVRPASYYQPEGVPALRSLNVKQGRIVLDDLVFFSKEDNETKLAKTRLKAGDVVLIRTGQPGTAAVVPPDLEGVNAIDLLIASISRDKCDPAYACAFFNSQGGREIVLGSQRGQIQKHLNVGSLSTALIPLPPLESQKEFSRRLTAITQLRTLQKEALARLDGLFADVQHRAFRGEL